MQIANELPSRRKNSTYVPHKSYCDCLCAFLAECSGLGPCLRVPLDLKVVRDIKIVDVFDLVGDGLDGRGHALER